MDVVGVHDSTTEHGAEEQQQQIADASNDPCRIDVPPIDGFHKQIAELVSANKTSSADNGAPATLQVEERKSVASVNSRDPKLRHRVSRHVPPKGTFSIRSSAAVLDRSPSSKHGGREVEAAGWEAAAYPYDAVTERHLELDRVIDDLVRDIAEDDVMFQVGGSHYKPHTGHLEGDIAGTPTSFSKSSSSATALPARTSAPLEAGVNDYHASLDREQPGRAEDTTASRNGGTLGHRIENGAESNGQPTNGNSERNPSHSFSREDSPASNRWKVLSPPRRYDEYYDNGDVGAEDGEEAVFRTADQPKNPNDMMELRESSPVEEEAAEEPVSLATGREGVPTPPTRSMEQSAGGRGSQRAGTRRPQRPVVSHGGGGRPVRVAASTKTSPHRNTKCSAKAHANKQKAESAVTTDASTAPAQAESDAAHHPCTKQRKGSHADPTASWQTHVATTSADREEAESDAAPRRGDVAAVCARTEEGTTVIGEFHLATAERQAAAAARRRAREERRRQQQEQEEQQRRLEKAEALQQVKHLAELPKPKGYDAFAEEGRRKRQLMEEAEREKRREAEANLTFRPTISQLAMERKLPAAGPATEIGKKGVTTADIQSFVAASQEWERKREHHRQLVQRQLEAQDEAARKRRFISDETERIVNRKQADSAAVDVSVFDRLASEAEQRRELQRKLEEKYTPSFKPQTHDPRSASAERQHGNAVTVDDPKEGADTGKAETPASYGAALYQRALRERAERERKLEKLRAEQSTAHVAPAKNGASSGAKRRTQENIDAFVAEMLARETEARAKFAQRVQREKEAEAQAAAQHGKSSLVDPHSAQIASRGRERVQMREEQKRRARELAEQQRRKEEEAAAARSVSRTPAKLSPSFEAHERRSEERKARQLGRLRQELLEQEMAECTFKPRVCPASEEMASRMRFSQVEADTDSRGEMDDFHAPSMNREPLSLSASLERANRPVTMRRLSTGLSHPPPTAMRERKPTDSSTMTASDASPVPRRPHRHPEQDDEESFTEVPAVASMRGTPPRSTVSLEQEIESLEQVLQQWKRMEEEVAAS